MMKLPGEERLIAPTMLYRFAVNCHQVTGQWDKQKGLELAEHCRLPVFSELDDQATFADLRSGWSREGLFFEVAITGKQQTPWCRNTQLLESDGLQLWIDTRATHNIHRASRFCHWFLFLPGGGGSRRNSPVASMLKINRARDFPKTFGQATPQVTATINNSGYSMSVHIPGSSLDGWNPDEHRRLGFHYAVVDRELGRQSLAIGSDLPVAEDPALWQTLELVD